MLTNVIRFWDIGDFPRRNRAYLRTLEEVVFSHLTPPINLAGFSQRRIYLREFPTSRHSGTVDQTNQRLVRSSGLPRLMDELNLA